MDVEQGNSSSSGGSYMNYMSEDSSMANEMLSSEGLYDSADDEWQRFVEDERRY